MPTFPTSDCPAPRAPRARVVGIALSLALLLSLGTLVSGPAAAPPKKQRVAALRQRLKRLSAQKKAAQAELRQTKREQGRLADQMEQIQLQLERANEALAGSLRRLRLAEAAVRTATRELELAEERLKNQQRRFGKRIAFYYREGSVSYLDVLVNARDLSDYLDRQYYTSRIMDQDAVILAELRQAQLAVQEQRARLVERERDLAEAHEENAELVQQVQARAEEQRELMARIRRERLLQEQEFQELQEDSGDVQRALEQELARRLANPRAYRSLPAWSGSFSMPARGPITSGFGYRTHPVLGYKRLHSGIDIGAGHGAPVYAASEGEVFFASWRGGYGRCIIVLHGGGVSTLYGHLSRIDVHPGQAVRRGQVIGAVGSTGLSTGPHLHFEVRRNGVPVNPR